jgi:Zinc-binding dehydrogenase
MEPVACIPDGVADDQGAALPIPAVTALRAVDLLEVTAGRHLMVMGAAGGVGGYAVQMARCRGAHVIATVRGDAGEARRLGAKEVYDSRGAGVIDALRAAHPDGVDAILDLVSGPETIPRDAEVVRPGGRLVSTIHAADEGLVCPAADHRVQPCFQRQSADLARRADYGRADAHRRDDHRASGPQSTWTPPHRCWTNSAAAACAARPSSACRTRALVGPRRSQQTSKRLARGKPALRRAGMARGPRSAAGWSPTAASSPRPDRGS